MAWGGVEGYWGETLAVPLLSLNWSGLITKTLEHFSAVKGLATKRLCCLLGYPFVVWVCFPEAGALFSSGDERTETSLGRP